jgi:hypothetical protein
MSKIGDDRGQATDPPTWWLDLFNAERLRRLEENANARQEKRKPPHVEGVVQLGAELATIVGRPKPWNHSAVSNFINGERYTREMAEAFSILYGLPRFEVIIHFNTRDKAQEIEMLLGRHGFTRPVPPPRVASVDQLAAALTESAEDQIAPVPSRDERTTRGRGAGRTTRRS